MKQFLIIISLLFASYALPIQSAYAEPTITTGVHEDEAKPALRGFAEIGFGTLFGAAAGGIPLVTTIFAKKDISLALTLGAIFYPAGVASGMILGGYLTESYSNYWAPFAGAYAGAIIADITAYFLADDFPMLSAFLVLALPVITSLVATEVSHTHHKHDAYYPAMITFPF